MNSNEYFSRAPITEAILEIHVDSDADLGSLESLTDEHVPPYRIGGEVAYPDAQGDSETVVGYVFRTEGKKQFFECRQDGFAFHQRAPYSGWDNFSGEARRLWTEYCNVVSPKEIRRAALRYINLLKIPVHSVITSDLWEPGSHVKIEDFLKIYPHLPEEIDDDKLGGMTGLFMQLQMVQWDLKAGVVINQARVETSDDDHLSIVMDIDIFGEREGRSWDQDSVWDYVELLRQRKNKIFKASITAKMEELIR